MAGPPTPRRRSVSYLVESAPDHRLFRSAIDRARTRYVPALVLAELDYFLRNVAEGLGIRRLATRDVRHFAAVRLRDGSSFELVVHLTDKHTQDALLCFREQRIRQAPT
jgi:predicted nucleic acid-binding protein